MGGGSTPAWWRCFTSAYLSGRMALQADAFAGCAKFCAVRLVTIAAGDAGGEHPALLERRIVVGLLDVADLAVGDDRCCARAARPHGSATATGRASSPRGNRRGARGTARRSRPPCAALPARRCACAFPVCGSIGQATPRRSSKRASSPLLGILALAERPPALLLARPGGVARALAVAGLAAHADFRPGRCEAIGLGVVVLAQARRVAFRAHEIPVLVQFGPVQDIVVPDLLVGIEVKPALAAFVLRPAVPGERQGLQAPVGEFDQILLQRIDAEGVFHLENGELAVGAVGLDQKFPVLAEEAGTHAVIIEARVVEIAEYGLVGGVLHCRLVLRAAPQFRFGLVAACAGLAADEGRRGIVLGIGDCCPTAN